MKTKQFDAFIKIDPWFPWIVAGNGCSISIGPIRGKRGESEQDVFDRFNLHVPRRLGANRDEREFLRAIDSAVREYFVQHVDFLAVRPFNHLEDLLRSGPIRKECRLGSYRATYETRYILVFTVADSPLCEKERYRESRLLDYCTARNIEDVLVNLRSQHGSRLCFDAIVRQTLASIDPFCKHSRFEVFKFPLNFPLHLYLCTT